MDKIRYEITQYEIRIYSEGDEPTQIMSYSHRNQASSSTRMDVSAQNVDELAAALAMAKRIKKAAEKATGQGGASFALFSEELKAALLSIGVQVVKDSRTRILHTKDNLPSPLSRLYWDDYGKMEKNYNRYSLLADNESDAQRKILAMAATNGASAEWIADFVSKGMPVLSAQDAGAPTMQEWKY